MANFPSSLIRSGKGELGSLVIVPEVKMSQYPGLIHWIPKRGKRGPGKPTLTYIDVLKRDTGLEAEEFQKFIFHGLSCNRSLYLVIYWLTHQGLLPF